MSGYYPLMLEDSANTWSSLQLPASKYNPLTPKDTTDYLTTIKPNSVVSIKDNLYPIIGF